MFLLIVISQNLYSQSNIYKVLEIDSTLTQYKIKIQKKSNKRIFTIYTFKQVEIDSNNYKKKYEKIKINGLYSLKFKEYRIGKPEFRYDKEGAVIHFFFIDRLEGLYYDSSPVSIFRRKNFWKPKKDS